MVCGDTYGKSKSILRKLMERGVIVIMTSERPPSGGGAKKKTDMRDADFYSKGAWRGDIKSVWLPPKRIEELREYVRRRNLFVALRTRVKSAKKHAEDTEIMHTKEEMDGDDRILPTT